MAVKVEFCRVDKTRKHRIHEWINTDTLEPLFGIEANVAYGKWVHVANDNGTPMFLPSRDEAKAIIKEWARA